MTASAASNTLHSPEVRFSTYSGAPSLHPSIAPTMASNPPTHRPVDSARTTPKLPRSPSLSSSSSHNEADLNDFADVFERMSNPRLEKQRFVPTARKQEEIHTVALGAKLERALGRRFSGQDAVFKRRVEQVAEKVAL